MKKALSFFGSLILCTIITLTAFADCYDNYYSIHGAIVYAKEWAYDYNPDYTKYDKDCTNFISQCITKGGGIPQKGNFPPNGGVANWHPWTVPGDLFTYLTRDLGYSYDYTYIIVDRQKNTATTGNSGNYTVNVGDILFFDFDVDNTIDHAAIIVGYKNGVPCYAGHSNARWMEPLSMVATYMSNSVKYYFVHMTNAQGMTDVTSQFFGRTVSLYSKKTGQKISIDGRDRFTIKKNDFFDEAGFLAADGYYLSVNINQNSTSAPAYVGERWLEYWESFRIFTNGRSYYIQSMANGKWMQIDDNGVFRAGGRAGSTWEEFDIR